MTAEPVPSAEVRRAVREVLSRGEYRRPGRSPLIRARDWVFRQIDELLATLSRGDAGSVIGWLLIGILVAVVATFAWRFVRGMTRAPEVAAAVTPVLRRTATDWLEEAAAQEARGEWRLALRSRYRALVADLAGRGLVDEVPGRTTGEYRSEVSANVPTVAGEFSGATELFELAWYGNRDTGPDESERFRTLADRVLVGAAR